MSDFCYTQLWRTISGFKNYKGMLNNLFAFLAQNTEKTQQYWRPVIKTSTTAYLVKNVPIFLMTSATKIIFRLY